MLYTIYKTTNLLTGMVYIGAHKTLDVNDGYLGSGTYLLNSIKKNGKHNFKKEILFVFNTPEEMYNKEAELVDSLFISEESTYNLKQGGLGGSKHSEETKKLLSQRIRSENHNKNISKSLLGHKHPRFGKSLTDEHKQKISQSLYGHTISDETRKLLSAKKIGANHPAFGTYWITNGVLNKRIPKDSKIPDGWHKGKVWK